jgi:hypothetical protein
MDIDKVGIKCPVCGKEKVFNKNNLGKIEDIRCIKCKKRFIVSTKLVESEQRFVNNVLERGVKEGVWDIDRFIAGGSQEQRGALGVDFVLYNVKKQGILWIEYKETSDLHFTNNQKLRFTQGYDTRWAANRFIGIKLSRPKKLPTMILYWTPNFMRVLPDDSFRPLTSARKQFSLSMKGLDKCFKINTFTELRKEYSRAAFEDLLFNWKNLSLYQLTSTRLGTGAKLINFPIEIAYNILYEKLKVTVENVGEDITQVYKRCSIRLPTHLRMIEDIDRIILSTLTHMYRPLYTEEFIEVLQKDPTLVPFIKNGKMDGRDLPKVINMSLQRGVRGGILEEIRGSKRKEIAYGIKNVKYIPLTKQSSFFLDDLGLILIEPNEVTTIKEIVKATSQKFGTVEARWIKMAKIELVNSGLIGFEIGRARKPTLIWLTDRGFNYIHRLGEFEIEIIYHS